MKNTLFALTLCTFAIVAAPQSTRASSPFAGSTDFEEMSAGDLPSDGFFDGDMTDSSIVEDASVAGDIPAADRPANYSYASTREKILSVETSSDAPLLRKLNANGNAVEGQTVYIDTIIKGTPYSYDAPAPTRNINDKIQLYFKVATNAVGEVVGTNLCALAGRDTSQEQKEYRLETPSAVGGISADKWYRIVLVHVPTSPIGEEGEIWPSFQIYLGGFGPEYKCVCGVKDTFPSLCADGETPGSVASVGFAGTGCVDDLVLSTNDPSTPALLDTTLSWPTNLTSVSYTLDGVDGEALTVADGSATIQGTNGAPVTLTGSIGYVTKSVTNAISNNGTISLPAIDISYFFPQTATSGNNQDGSAGHPFEIANVDDLKALAAAANAGVLAGGTLHFIQTANIDMSTAGAFGGIGAVGAENETTLTMNAFEGVYDGNNKTISNITFTNRKGSALFNLVRNATIKDLTIDTVSYQAAFAETKLGGAMFVGNGVNCTLQHLVSLGNNGVGNPSTYNAAGIANRLEGRGGPVRVIGCTNNAAIYGCYSKIGGICAIVQGADQTVTFVDCANTGAIVANGTTAQTTLSGKTPGVDGAAGILAYTQGGNNLLSLTNCVNTGTITGVSGTKIASILGYTTASGITIVGGSAQADVKSVNTGADKVAGAKFATVDNGVATFVADDALAAGNTYKVMSGNATATYEFTAPGTISFNTALATPTYAITSSGLAGNVTSATEAPVTTYTAGYFPRTATAGQDGTAEHPFEIADENDLQALKAFVGTTNCANLCFVQTADIALTAAWEGIGVKGGKDLVNGGSKDIPTYEAGAFSGTYDGGNYTISNFQMENGTDYGALFNSINNATIKNLKISWGSNTLCANSSGTGGDTGATFVGVARGSLLQNLTALAGTVSASKDFGGIVGYLMGGSTVDSCTNELNIASLLTKGGRKCGGIAIITQDGTGSAIIRNCKNSGTVTAANKGGLAGYIGVATTIDGCENTAALQLFHFQSGSVTVSGVNKGNATVASNDKSGGITNLYFATVDGNVATFVADNALALNGEYKVMSAGATATFAFAEAGTIAFDTALYTPTYAITAAEGLTLTDATSGTVKTYTATAQQSADPWHTPENDAGVTNALVALAEDGISIPNGVITTKNEFEGLVNYIKSKLNNQDAEPKDLTSNQKANAALSYALNATTIPDSAIEDGDVTVESIVPGADGSMEITIAIDDLTVGTLSDATAKELAARVLYNSKGGDDLASLSTGNVEVQVTGSLNGKIIVTVTPDDEVYAETPDAFFVKPVILK